MASWVLYGNIINSNVGGLSQDFKSSLTNLLEHELDDIRMASALCIGLVSVSDLKNSIQFMIDNMRSSPHQYYFIVAFNELIKNRTNTHQLDTLAPYLDSLCNLFFEIAEQTQSDAARPLMADCIGKLTMINPEYGFKNLVEKTSSKSAKVKTLAIAAFKYSLQHIGEDYDSILLNCIDPIIKLLSDESIEVQRVCLVTLSMVLRTSPHLLRKSFKEFVQLVQKQTIFRVILVN